MKSLPLAEVQTNFPAIIHEVEQGEEIVISCDEAENKVAVSGRKNAANRDRWIVQCRLHLSLNRTGIFSSTLVGTGHTIKKVVRDAAVEEIRLAIKRVWP